MPPAIKANLVTHQGTLDDIAKTADTLMAYNYNTPNYSFSSPIQSSPQDSTSFHVRSNRTNTNYTSTQQRQQRPGSNYNHSSVPQNVRAFNDQQKPQVCRYHLYYGKSPKRCRRWCMMNNPNVPTYPDSRPTSRSSSPAPRNNPEN